MPHDASRWNDYAEALAFVGNSLLAPMSQTQGVGLDPAFWAGFPDFGSPDVSAALTRCEDYASAAQSGIAEGADPVLDASVEYTRLFVGPPKPATPPWETFYREGAAAGFGKPTFEMRGLLREAGLEVSNENNQYADHVGIELLYLSVLCGRGASEPDAAEEAVSFAATRALPWMTRLREAVVQAAPGGYIDALLGLALALLGCLVAEEE